MWPSRIPIASHGSFIWFDVYREREGRRAGQLDVLGPIQHSHAAATQLLQDAILGDGLADHGGVHFPGGSLRRSSSKKLKMKLTLFTAAVCSVPGAFSTAKRLPSGCRSKL